MDLWNISQCEYEFCGVELHQPTLRELSKIFKEEEDLIFILKMLISSLKETLKLQQEKVTEFQVFLSLLAMDTETFGLTIQKKKKFLQLIELCFQGYKLSIMKESFILKKDDTIVVIDNSNFE